MSNSDLIDLYSGRILKFAANIPLTDRLDEPDATIKRRSPLCGSTVTVDINVTDGKISAYGQDVKACALGQASASIIAADIVGLSYAEVERTRDALLAMLKQDGPVPSAPFGNLEVLLPAKEFKNRHASIMLAIEATLEAFAQIENPDSI